MLKRFAPLMIVLLLGILFFSGCSSGDDHIEIEQPNLTFEGVTGGEWQTTKVLTDGDWKIQPDHEDWITAVKQDGIFIVISVEDNTEETQRKGEVVLSSGSAKAVLTVWQEGAVAEN